MPTQVTFTADAALKKQALAKAKRQGFPLKTLLVYALKGFVTGTISFGLTASEPEVEPVEFSNQAINAKAAKLAELLS